MTQKLRTALHHCPLGTASKCRLAEAPLVTAVATVGPHEWASIHLCSACGHGVTVPPIEDVAALYDARDSQDYQPADNGLAEAIKRFAFTWQARSIIRGLDFTPESVIDFACGSGLLTTCIADSLSKNTRISALDFFDTPPRDMGRVNYLPFERIEELQGNADLLTCFHVLEHDNDPDDVMRRLTGLMKPGGTLVIEVPNVDCIWGRVFGKHWDNWYLPFHRTHFSRTSLRSLLERHGFDIITEKPVCTPSMGRTLTRLLRVKNSLPVLLAGAALHPIQWIGEVLTLRPSALRATARLKNTRRSMKK